MSGSWRPPVDLPPFGRERFAFLQRRFDRSHANAADFEAFYRDLTTEMPQEIVGSLTDLVPVLDNVGVRDLRLMMPASTDYAFRPWRVRANCNGNTSLG